MSVAEIEFAEVYENGKPKLGGLMDPRQGVLDRRFIFNLCRYSFQERSANFKCLVFQCFLSEDDV